VPRSPDNRERRPRRGVRHALLLTILVLVLAEAGARSVVPRLPEEPVWGTGQLDIKVAQMARLGTADVVVVGSSVGGVAVDPVRLEELGAGPVYNASIVGSSPRTWERWLGEVVLESLQPRMVVLVVSPRELNDAGVEQAAALTAYVESEGRRRHLGATAPWHETVLSSSALVSHRGVLRQPSTWAGLLGARDPSASAERIGAQGENLTRRSWAYRNTEEFQLLAATPALHDFATGGIEIASLERTIAAVRSAGAVPVVVDMVVLESELLDGRLHARFAEGHAALAEGMGRHDVPVLHPPRWLRDPVHFGDPFHLNGAGTERFTAWLAAALGDAGQA
jgi:hypothetical protein